MEAAIAGVLPSFKKYYDTFDAMVQDDRIVPTFDKLEKLAVK